MVGPVPVRILEAVIMTALNVSCERCANCGYYFDDRGTDFEIAIHYRQYPFGISYIGYDCPICGYMEEI